MHCPILHCTVLQCSALSTPIPIHSSSIPSIPFFSVLLGIRSDIAENGQEAVDAVLKKGDKYDVIFMDHTMPVMVSYILIMSIIVLVLVLLLVLIRYHVYVGVVVDYIQVIL